ncbi:MAG: MATE family efflux transporter [Oscillospiraceae bacterium]|nr:MATE family efflux transporter [Oscillospiraceae bacterium]
MLEKVIFMNLSEKRLFSNQALIRLIIPLVIEQGLTILVGMCDSMMVSSAGEAAISGVSLVDMINAIVLTLFAALATGGAVVTSQFLGAKDQEKARQSAGQLVLMALVLGVAAMALCLLFARPVMKLFFGSISEDVMAAGLLYLRITALSFPFIALYNAGAAIFRSLGNSKVSMKVSMLMNVINVTGNAICVLGLRMGVAGVAIPTLISRAVAAGLILKLAARKEQVLYVDRDSVLKVKIGMMGSILRIGIPSACENTFFALGRTVVVSMIAIFGTVQTSANAVANTLDSLGIIIGQAMGLAMITVVGQCIGASDTKQAEYYIKKLLAWCYLLQGATNILIMVFCRTLIGFYSSLSPETEQLAWQLVMLHSFFAVFMWPISFVLPNALRAASDAKFTMWVAISSMILMRIGLSWVLCVQFQLGALGVWIAMIMDWVMRISFYVPRAIRGKWKTKYKAA